MISFRVPVGCRAYSDKPGELHVQTRLFAGLAYGWVCKCFPWVYQPTRQDPGLDVASLHEKDAISGGHDGARSEVRQHNGKHGYPEDRRGRVCTIRAQVLVEPVVHPPLHTWWEAVVSALPHIR